MARLIKDTPTLYGDDARRFLDSMEHVDKETPEKMAEIKRDYAYMMSIFEN